MTSLGLEKAKAWGEYIIVTPDGILLQPRTEKEVIAYFKWLNRASRPNNHIIKLSSMRYKVNFFGTKLVEVKK